MSLPLTLALLAAVGLLLAFSVWRVRQKHEPGTLRLLDWHYILFPAILAVGLLALHAFNLLVGR